MLLLAVDILKELGLLNITTVVFLVNGPSIIFTIMQDVRFKKTLRENYIDRKSYEKDVQSLLTTIIRPLTDQLSKTEKCLKELNGSINELDKQLRVHEEKFNTI